MMSESVEIPAALQVFMEKMSGMMAQFSERQKSANDLLTERLSALQEKQKQDVETLKNADTHIKGNLDSKIQSVEVLIDKRVTKIESKLEAHDLQLDEQCPRTTVEDIARKIELHDRDLVESKSQRKVIYTILAGVVTLLAALLSNMGWHLFGH